MRPLSKFSDSCLHSCRRTEEIKFGIKMALVVSDRKRGTVVDRLLYYSFLTQSPSSQLVLFHMVLSLGWRTAYTIMSFTHTCKL